MSARIITVPNLLTVFRMVLIPVFVSLLFYQNFGLALGIFILAGVTDGLDGLLARRFNQKSQLGTILDPIADKLLLVTAFIVLSMRSVFPQPLPSHLPVPFWVTIAVISRDVFILVGAAAINIVTGFRGFRPSLLGKINTFVQIIAIGLVMFAASVPYGTGYYLPTVYTTVFAFAVLSGAHYVFFVSKLVNEDRPTATHSKKLVIIYLTRAGNKRIILSWPPLLTIMTRIDAIFRWFGYPPYFVRKFRRKRIVK